jgi:hypothetical protein
VYLGLGRTEVSFRLTMNVVIIRLQRYSGQPKASVNWGQPYIKEGLRSDFVQYKYTEASFRLSELWDLY